MLRKIIFLATLITLVSALLPSVVLAAQPPPVVPGEYWMVIANMVRVYANESFTVVTASLYNTARVRSYVQILLGGPSGPVLVDYSIISCENSHIIARGSGWLPYAAFGLSLQWLGTSLPVALIAERGQEVLSPVANCQKWLECNGERRLPRIWDRLDQKRIITTRPKDCVPYRNMPRPRGCYP